jgi:prepilin-type N-terminal cleavage/methylation domain-containing protein
MPANKSQSGMTLVEILVSMVIMGIIVTAIYNIFRVHNLMAAKQEETTMMQQELLSAMADMTEELRMCGFKPMGEGSFGFEATATNQTSVYCTRGITINNNSTDIIAYTRNSTNNDLLVYISSDNEWVPAASNISDLNFKYFDDEGAEILNPNAVTVKQIRMIEIKATAIPSQERAKLNINSRTMHSKIWLRNMSL